MMRKLLLLVVVLALISGSLSCGVEKSDVSGTYLCTQGSKDYDKGNILELKKDGSLYVYAPGKSGVSGEWKLDGDEIYLIFEFFGLTWKGNIKGDTISLEEGSVWEKEKEEAIKPTASTSTPEEATATPTSPTMPSEETGSLLVDVVNIEDFSIAISNIKREENEAILYFAIPKVVDGEVEPQSLPIILVDDHENEYKGELAMDLGLGMISDTRNEMAEVAEEISDPELRQKFLRLEELSEEQRRELAQELGEIFEEPSQVIEEALEEIILELEAELGAVGILKIVPKGFTYVETVTISVPQIAPIKKVRLGTIEKNYSDIKFEDPQYLKEFRDASVAEGKKVQVGEWLSFTMGSIEPALGWWELVIDIENKEYNPLSALVKAGIQLGNGTLFWTNSRSVDIPSTSKSSARLSLTIPTWVSEGPPQPRVLLLLYRDMKGRQQVLKIHTMSPEELPPLVGQGPREIEDEFIEVYQSNGGKDVMGDPLELPYTFQDVLEGTSVVIQDFKNGSIYYYTSGSLKGNAFALSGKVAKLYADNGGPNGWLGLPRTGLSTVTVKRRANLEPKYPATTAWNNNSYSICKFEGGYIGSRDDGGNYEVVQYEKYPLNASDAYLIIGGDESYLGGSIILVGAEVKDDFTLRLNMKYLFAYQEGWGFWKMKWGINPAYMYLSDSGSRQYYEIASGGICNIDEWGYTKWDLNKEYDGWIDFELPKMLHGTLFFRDGESPDDRLFDIPFELKVSSPTPAPAPAPTVPSTLEVANLDWPELKELSSVVDEVLTQTILIVDPEPMPLLTQAAAVLDAIERTPKRDIVREKTEEERLVLDTLGMLFAEGLRYWAKVFHNVDVPSPIGGVIAKAAEELGNRLAEWWWLGDLSLLKISQTYGSTVHITYDKSVGEIWVIAELKNPTGHIYMHIPVEPRLVSSEGGGNIILSEGIRPVMETVRIAYRFSE